MRVWEETHLLQKHSAISIQPDDAYWIRTKSVELGPILALGVVGNESPGSYEFLFKIASGLPDPFSGQKNSEKYR